ncbi:MAG: O-antigen ligase family protein [Bacteroidota bacterium]
MTGWTYTPPGGPRRHRRLADRYLLGLSVVLLGYALFGRAFAYLGVPPVFIGEIMLALGLLLVAASPERRATFMSSPILWGAALLAWVAIRTVPYIGTYGLDAIRDAMVAGYALFALVAVGLVTSQPERIRDLIVRYRWLVLTVGTVGWVLYLIYRTNMDLFPKIPWAPHVHVVENKPGDLVVHMAGITAFVVLGWKRVSPVLLTILVVGTGAAMAGGRGGMVGFIVGITAFALFKPKVARFGRLAYVGVMLLIVGIAVDTSGVEINEGNRSLSVDQLIENVKSVFGQSDQAMLATTTEWRIEWWTDIVEYTVLGDHFWLGKGFGINLATDDGFQVERSDALRSPHNVHLTFLARAGVPGLILWLLLQATWVWTVLRAWRDARRQRLDGWVGFYALCSVYWAGALVNASFDVYLEGPMGAVWFWTVFGLALAGAQIQRTHPHLLDDVREGGGDSRRATPERPSTFHWVPAAETPAPVEPSVYETT